VAVPWMVVLQDTLKQLLQLLQLLLPHAAVAS
jgi:hypothetical protein